MAVDASPETLELAAAKQLPPDASNCASRTSTTCRRSWGCSTARSPASGGRTCPCATRPGSSSRSTGGLLPGARVALLDNRYVEGSSTPISHRDEDGNTYQRRRLEDGSEHVVLKNFPTWEELSAVVAPFGNDMQLTELEYYWVFAYEKK